MYLVAATRVSKFMSVLEIFDCFGLISQYFLSLASILVKAAVDQHFSRLVHPFIRSVRFAQQIVYCVSKERHWLLPCEFELDHSSSEENSGTELVFFVPHFSFTSKSPKSSSELESWKDSSSINSQLYALFYQCRLLFEFFPLVLQRLFGLTGNARARKNFVKRDTTLLPVTIFI